MSKGTKKRSGKNILCRETLQNCLKYFTINLTGTNGKGKRWRENMKDVTEILEITD